MNLTSLKVLNRFDPEDGLAEWESGTIRIFDKSLMETAQRISFLYGGASCNYICNDLFSLTVFHELYHAGKFKDSEAKADEFAWKAFKLMYKRNPCFPKKYWRKIPR
jgi:hypothetical protein